MTDKKQRTIVIVVPPKAQPLDVSGPLAAFREAYRQTNGEIQYDVRTLAAGVHQQIDIDGMTMIADHALSDPDFPIDTLLVAGTHDYHQAFSMAAFHTWLRRRTPGIRRYGSVCTGAFFLGAAGLLNGKQVTTHWQQAKELAARYPQAEVFPDSVYVQDGALCTSAGITAGIDLSLKLIEDDYGRELALKIARRLVVFLRRPGGQSQFSAHLAAQMAAESRIEAVQRWVLANLAQDLSLPVLADRAAMSVRNFSRLFRRETGGTPADFVELARVDAARRMLEDSETQLQRIASQCGFTNVDLMRRAFIRRIGINPSDYRQRFYT
ncbi:HTH-type transcriptional regulator CdhR [Vibrio aerogenes CECT 7868]|uniref:HTH-type transcriptional regulator CdhR n=1 Tax=Vibrio aerogenes CECT 7868 TaxID=1216006 RepID=A0A1M5XZD1_9VIBR|nr:GlxA family transcriptional regulator [Vibrio aerogenes]SHI05076.1 HTH-type transcriptional regulator CdhR [Vibrio aerogenes CECT 7868]